jgi:hypothetical protein
VLLCCWLELVLPIVLPAVFLSWEFVW